TGGKPAPNPRLVAERPEAYTPMGLTAENVAARWNVSREDQDRFGVRSHERALRAIAEGRFRDEIVPVHTRVFEDGAWRELTFDTDGGPRQTTLEQMAKLPPVFKVGGTVTAGTSAQMSDGAAATL